MLLKLQNGTRHGLTLKEAAIKLDLLSEEEFDKYI